MNALRSVRARVTLAAMVVAAVVLTVAAVVLVELVETDLIDLTEEALLNAVEDEIAQFDESFLPGSGSVADPFGPRGGYEALPGSVSFGPGIQFFGPPPDAAYAFDIEGIEYKLGYFDIDPSGVAIGELWKDTEMVSVLVFDPEEGVLIDALDPSSGLPERDEKTLALLDQVIFETGEVGPDRVLIAASPLDEVRESVGFVVDALLVIVPISVVVLGVATWFLVGRALQPVALMSRQVGEISERNLDQRVVVPPSGDEISKLARLMNDMLGRLQRSGERQRQFSADASHELRSPLSSIRAAAEMIGRRPDGPRTAGLAGDVVAEADRMDALITDLLDLARLDEDRRAIETETVDLAAVVDEVVEAASATGDRPDVEIRTSPSGEDFLVSGSPGQLQRLVRNLVDNAIRHADGAVEVRLELDGAELVLSVADDGPGVAESDRNRIFERFTRLDLGRARSTGGAGLGLALVRAISQRHGGTVTAGRSSRLAGALFEVRLPTGVR